MYQSKIRLHNTRMHKIREAAKLLKPAKNNVVDNLDDFASNMIAKLSPQNINIAIINSIDGDKILLANFQKILRHDRFI